MRPALFLILIFFALYPAPAAALDCASAPLELSGLPETQVIFEGPVLAERELSLLEKGKLKMTGYELLGGGLSDLRIYTMNVQRNWQGTKKDANIEILRNTSWGDKFTVGEEYLVFADKLDDYLEADICGHTTHTTNAEKNRKFLIDIIGVGHDFRVKGEDMECDTDEDCTTIITHCGSCSCGTPVNINALDKYRRIREETCDDGQMREMCEMECPAITPRCIEYRCEM